MATIEQQAEKMENAPVIKKSRISSVEVEGDNEICVITIKGKLKTLDPLKARKLQHDIKKLFLTL